MLFLLNDTVLALTSEDMSLPVDGRTLSTMRTDIVSGLCAEMFSANPSLHQTDLAKAKKVAALVMAKSPQVNAALFVPAFPGCPPNKVTCRFAQVTFDVLSRLMTIQNQGRDTSADADDQVWRRLAA